MLQYTEKNHIFPLKQISTLKVVTIKFNKNKINMENKLSPLLLFRKKQTSFSQRICTSQIDGRSELFLFLFTKNFIRSNFRDGYFLRGVPQMERWILVEASHLLLEFHLQLIDLKKFLAEKFKKSYQIQQLQKRESWLNFLCLFMWLTSVGLMLVWM